jgi:hypothetical protein
MGSWPGACISSSRGFQDPLATDRFSDSAVFVQLNHFIVNWITVYNFHRRCQGQECRRQWDLLPALAISEGTPHSVHHKYRKTIQEVYANGRTI